MISKFIRAYNGPLFQKHKHKERKKERMGRGGTVKGIEFFFFFLIRNKEKYIKRRKDTREGRDTREREETRKGWKVLPTKTKIEQKRKHPTLEN